MHKREGKPSQAGAVSTHIIGMLTERKNCTLATAKSKAWRKKKKEFGEESQSAVSD